MTVSLTANNAALVAASALYKATKSHKASLEKLATGNRINSAKDDPGSIHKVSRLTSEARGIQMGIRNAMEFQSILSIGDNTNLEISNELQSLRAKSILAMNSTYSAQDRADLQTDAAQIIAGVDQLATLASYNNQKLTDGTFTSKSVSLGSSTANQISVSLNSAKAAALGQYYISGTSHLKAGSNNTQAATDVTSQSLSITGKTSASVSVATGSSAKTAAAAVNATKATTGVSATASTTLKLDALTNLASGKSISFKIGSTQIASTLVTSTDLSALATTINLSTSSTGVTAVVGSSNAELLLSNTDGADILIDDFLTTNTSDADATLDVTSVNSRTGAEVGSAIVIHHKMASSSRQTDEIDSVIAIGQLEIGYHKSFSMTGGASTSTLLVQSNTVESAFVSTIDISTQAGATSAVRVLDSALEKVSENRVTIGATSSRLDSATNFLTSINIPVSMSISQIKDTDFATETLNLTKSQLIMDNAAAMLAQANTSMGSIQERILGGL